MADFLEAVNSDGGKREPVPVTIVSEGAEVDISALLSGIATAAKQDALASVIGTTADAAWDGASATATVISLLKKIANNTLPL